MRHAFLSIATCVVISVLHPYNLNAQEIDPFSASGTRTIVDVHSPGLEGNLLGDSPDRPVTIYLPPGYETSPENHYPVIYFLHGILCNHLTFFGGYRPEQDFQVILERMFNTKALPPVMVVSPNSNNAYHGSFYTNSYVTGQWEDFIVEDLIDFIDQNYRTLPSRESRGLSGHSMGGYGTMKLAMDHPSLFNAAYMLSPYGLILEEYIFDIAFEDTKEAVLATSQDQLSVNGKAMVMQAAAFAPDSSGQPFMGQFPLTEYGEPVDSVLQKWLRYDPYTMLDSHLDSLMRYRAIQYDCGTEDQYGFYPVCVAFSDTLHKYGIDHVFESYEGDHGNKLDERMEERLIPFFRANLKGEAPGIVRTSASYLTNSDTLAVEMDREGTVYIVPVGTIAIMDSILKKQLISSEADSGIRVVFPLKDFSLGKYWIYGRGSEGSSFSVPLPFGVDTKTGIPVLSVETDTVIQGEDFVFQCDKSGTLFLGNSGTTPETVDQAGRIKATAEVNPGVALKIETAALYPKTYVVLVRDLFGFFSEPVQVHVLPDATGIPGSADEVSGIYPNPAGNVLHLVMESPGVRHVEIHSLTGRLLSGFRMEGSSRTLDISFLPEGAYILTIRSRDNVSLRKIIKL